MVSRFDVGVEHSGLVCKPFSLPSKSKINIRVGGDSVLVVSILVLLPATLSASGSCLWRPRIRLLLAFLA
jgi:hypothetical protein